MEEIKTIGGYPLPRGADGGHYTPIITQTAADTMTVEFRPSKAGMAAVEPVTVKLPVGSGDGSGQNLDPVAKTEGMTQPVGADADGKLWTAPGSVLSAALLWLWLSCSTSSPR